MTGFPRSGEEDARANVGTQKYGDVSKTTETFSPVSGSDSLDLCWRAAKLVDVLAGENPARETCPVVPVAISGGGEGDQPVESPEVKVLVGKAKAESAPTKEGEQIGRS